MPARLVGLLPLASCVWLGLPNAGTAQAADSTTRSSSVSTPAPGSTTRRAIFALAFGPSDYTESGSINGLPNLNIFVMWWDDRGSAWRTGKLQGYVVDDDEALLALEREGARRLDARGCGKRPAIKTISRRERSFPTCTRPRWR